MLQICPNLNKVSQILHYFERENDDKVLQCRSQAWGNLPQHFIFSKKLLLAIGLGLFQSAPAPMKKTTTTTSTTPLNFKLQFKEIWNRISSFHRKKNLCMLPFLGLYFFACVRPNPSFGLSSLERFIPIFLPFILFTLLQVRPDVEIKSSPNFPTIVAQK